MALPNYPTDWTKNFRHRDGKPIMGRPPGTSTRVSINGILAAIQAAGDGKPFIVTLAEDYQKARESGDKALVFKYQQLILNKIVADKHSHDINIANENIVDDIVDRLTAEWNRNTITIDKDGNTVNDTVNDSEHLLSFPHDSNTITPTVEHPVEHARMRQDRSK